MNAIEIAIHQGEVKSIQEQESSAEFRAAVIAGAKERVSESRAELALHAEGKLEGVDSVFGWMSADEVAEAAKNVLANAVELLGKYGVEA